MMGDGPDQDATPVLEEWQRVLEEARREAAYFRRLAQEAGRRRLQETETTSQLIERVRQTERELEAVRDELEQRVHERTAELTEVNQKLSLEIAERERVTDALRASEEQFRSFMRHFPGLAYIKEADTRVVFVNEGFRTLLGLDPKRLVGLTNREAFPGEFGAKITDEDLEVLERGESVRIEEYFGGRSWITYKFVIPVPRGAKRLGGLTLDVTDIESAEQERLRFERQIQQNQRLESLGVLAGGIAHDFNNLLTAILGNLGLARADLDERSPVCECLIDAEAATRSAAELCRQMLAYSGRGNLVVEEVALNDLVRGTLEPIASSVSKRAAVQLRLADGLPTVKGDPAQLRQVVMNLVINASEAVTRGDGVVTVCTGVDRVNGERRLGTQFGEPMREGVYVWIEVADTGCGIGEEAQQRIFEPFFTTKFTGRGLGLSAVLGIVRGLSGTVELESRLGHGARFRVWLPVAATTRDRASSASGDPNAWRGSGTILVVDDEEVVRRIAVRLVRRLGFGALTAESGREALETYQRHSGAIRAVLLDLTMPELDGVETFRALRRLDPEARVLLASGYTECDAASRFGDVSPDGFVAKPFDLEGLRSGLREVLEAPLAGT